jgi:hypothetical protein
MKTGDKVYVGDGVYAMLDYAQLILTTESRAEAENTIYLDMNTAQSLANILFKLGIVGHE